MTEALVAEIRWDADRPTFERGLKKFIKLARNEGKVIPLPVPLALETLVMPLAQVNCDGCDALCCKGGTQGGAVQLAPGEHKALVEKYGDQGFITAPPHGGILQPCRFLKGRLCTIYAERPMGCMLFPMQPHGGVATSRHATPMEALSVASSCPEGRRIAKAIYKSMYLIKQKYWSMPGEELRVMMEGRSR